MQSKTAKSSKLFVANLSSKVIEKDLRHLFEKYGKIFELTLKEKQEKFAFIEFEDIRDAENALESLSGKELYGKPLRIEYSHGGQILRILFALLVVKKDIKLNNVLKLKLMALAFGVEAPHIKFTPVLIICYQSKNDSMPPRPQAAIPPHERYSSSASHHSPLHSRHTEQRQRFRQSANKPNKSSDMSSHHSHKHQSPQYFSKNVRESSRKKSKSNRNRSSSPPKAYSKQKQPIDEKKYFETSSSKSGSRQKYKNSYKPKRETSIEHSSSHKHKEKHHRHSKEIAQKQSKSHHKEHKHNKSPVMQSRQQPYSQHQFQHRQQFKRFYGNQSRSSSPEQYPQESQLGGQSHHYQGSSSPRNQLFERRYQHFSKGSPNNNRQRYEPQQYQQMERQKYQQRQQQSPYQQKQYQQGGVHQFAYQRQNRRQSPRSKSSHSSSNYSPIQQRQHQRRFSPKYQEKQKGFQDHPQLDKQFKSNQKQRDASRSRSTRNKVHGSHHHTSKDSVHQHSKSQTSGKPYKYSASSQIPAVSIQQFQQNQYTYLTELEHKAQANYYPAEYQQLQNYQIQDEATQQQSKQVAPAPQQLLDYYSESVQQQPQQQQQQSAPMEQEQLQESQNAQNDTNQQHDYQYNFEHGLNSPNSTQNF